MGYVYMGPVPNGSRPKIGPDRHSFYRDVLEPVRNGHWCRVNRLRHGRLDDGQIMTTKPAKQKTARELPSSPKITS